MRLPPGVTGFGRPPSGHQPTDFAAFLAACHAAARRLGGKVLRAESCAGQVTPNFHRVTLSVRRETVEVICNARYPLVATIRPLEAGSTALAFIDLPGLAEEMADVGGFEVIRAGELDTPVRQEHLSGLDRAERRQAAYWGPRTVGEAVFNFWD